MSDVEEKAGNHWFLKLVAAPVLVAILVGSGSSYFTAQKMMTEVASQVSVNIEAIKRNGARIDTFKELLEIMRSLEKEMTRRGEWMINSERRFSYLEDRAADRYTKSDADKDQRLIMEKLKNLEYKIAESK